MTLFVGIDVAKQKFDVALLLPNGKFRSKVFANQTEGFVEFVHWLDLHRDGATTHLLLEATGRYGEALTYAPGRCGPYGQRDQSARDQEVWRCSVEPCQDRSD